MPAIVEMPAIRLGSTTELWMPWKSGSFGYCYSLTKSICVTSLVPLPIPSWSPTMRLDIPHGIVVNHSSWPCLSWFGLCYPRTPRWKTDLNIKKNDRLLSHCWGVAMRCSCTARPQLLKCLLTFRSKILENISDIVLHDGWTSVQRSVHEKKKKKPQKHMYI